MTRLPMIALLLCASCVQKTTNIGTADVDPTSNTTGSGGATSSGGVTLPGSTDHLVSKTRRFDVHWEQTALFARVQG